MEFGWHDAKRASNICKHGIDFADMFPEFADDARLIARDTRYDYGEDRYNMIARIGTRTFHVTYTERGGIIWLISARRANRREQERHAAG